MRKISCLPIIGLLLLAGCVAKPELDLSLVPPLIREFHGDENLRCMLQPDKVEVYRASYIDPFLSDADRTLAGYDYKLGMKGPDLTPEQIDVLRRCVIDLRGYGANDDFWRRQFLPKPTGIRFYGSGCAWRPAIVFVCHRGGDQVNIVICFNCGDWAFEAKGQRYNDENFSYGSRTGGVQPALRWLAVNQFPDDPSLKMIPLADWWERGKMAE